MKGHYVEKSLGLLLILFGVLFFLDNIQAIDFDFWKFLGNAWPALLIALGLWIIYRQTKAKTDWKKMTEGGKASLTFGDFQVRPNKIEQQGAEYDLGFGDLELDLSQTILTNGENKIRLSLGFGEMKITLPSAVACKIACTCGVGDVNLFSKKSSGFSVDQEHIDSDYDSSQIKLIIKAKCGMGSIAVHRDQ